MRQESHDLAGDHRNACLKRPDSAEFAEVGDAGRLDQLPPVLRCTAPQKRIPPNPFYNRNRRDVDLMVGQIRAQPVLD